MTLRKLTGTLVANAALLTSLPANERPNIVLIMADDMGFSDIGAYGGEIETPSLDALAKGGMKFSNPPCLGTEAKSIKKEQEDELNPETSNFLLSP